MALVSLPKELLLMVTDHLPVRSIESLALTFNSQVTLLCLPLLKPLFARRARIKHYNLLFGEIRYDPIETIELPEDLEKLGFFDDDELDMPTPPQRLQRLEYLNLKEDLNWLQPLDKGTAQQMLSYDRHTPLGAAELAALQADAESVNITLPPSFIKFFTNHDLITRIASASANYFRITSGLRKVPSAVDKGAGAYSLSIYSDQQGCGYWDLYLEPGPKGYHCVLSTPWDSGMELDEYSDTERYESTGAKDASGSRREMSYMFHGDLSLEGISFEEWLAMMYYEQWLWFVADSGELGEGCEGLKEYVRQMYVKKEPKSLHVEPLDPKLLDG